MTEEELYDMSDEELEAAVKASRTGQADLVENDTVNDDVIENEHENENADEQEDDLEQPIEDEDSDDDTGFEDKADEESEEDSDSKSDELDGDNANDEEQTDKDAKKTESDEQPTHNYKFRANGKEYEFTDEEVKSQFPKVFGQAMDYTKKMQAIKPWRKTIDAIESAKLNHNDVNLMIDVLKGDKGAIAEVLKRTGVDALDIDSDESKYIAKDYGRNETALAIEDVVSKISADPEYSKTEKILSKEWDDRSWTELSKDPNLIELLHVDVRSGMYDLVQPIAEKLKVYDRGAKSDLDYYTEAAKIYYAQQQSETTRQQELEKINTQKARLTEVKNKERVRSADKLDSVKRKSAAPAKKVVKTKANINYLDDSDEAFEKWHKELQERY